MMMGVMVNQEFSNLHRFKVNVVVEFSIVTFFCRPDKYVNPGISSTMAVQDYHKKCKINKSVHHLKVRLLATVEVNLR